MQTQNGARKEDGGAMMPLTLASPGKAHMIRKVGGTPDVKKHLEDMGFVAGGYVTVVTEWSGDIIVNVKDSRVAISRTLAQKIMI